MTVQVSKVTSVRLCWIWFRSILWVESALEPHSLEVCNQWVSGQLLLNLSVRINAKRAETAGKYQRATPAQSMETKTNAATLAKNVFFFHSSQDYFWTKKCKEVLPGTKFLPGTCLLAQTSCQEPASSQKIPARNLLPRRKFLPGGKFLAQNLCGEALPLGVPASSDLPNTHVFSGNWNHFGSHFVPEFVFVIFFWRYSYS